ncbi:MAG TPA: hypothetical protein VMA54_03830 [Steroidobacteraceae bacterium]|nr:hypothetical protein [Steroidobacteraceae bacterium]
MLINYFDRISLSVAGPQLEHSLQLTPADLGLGAVLVAGLVGATHSIRTLLLGCCTGAHGLMRHSLRDRIMAAPLP